MEKYDNYVEAIVAHSRVPQLHVIGERTFALLPMGYSIHDIDIDRYEPQPARKKGQITLTDAHSFIQFVKDQGSLASCVIYVGANYVDGNVQVVAVLNDHDDNPQWRDYRAIFAPIKSVEWGIWTAHDGKKMPQADFAALIEDNVKDFADETGYPTGADMYTMATNFEANKNIVVKSAIRSASGTVDFVYSDKEDNATLQHMQAYEKFRIGIQIFQNGKAYGINARLRYRTDNGKLLFWYDLQRPDLALQTALNESIALIRDQSGFRVLMGNPG